MRSVRAVKRIPTDAPSASASAVASLRGMLNMMTSQIDSGGVQRSGPQEEASVDVSRTAATAQVRRGEEFVNIFLQGFYAPVPGDDGPLVSLAKARTIAHAFNLCWSHIGGTYTLILRRETRLTREWLAEAEVMAREHAMTYLAEVMVPWSDGFVLIEQGAYAEGYAKLTSVLHVWRNAGALLSIPWLNEARATALKHASTFGMEVTHLLEALPGECRCLILARGAVVGQVNELPDLTPDVRRRLGL